MSDEFILNTKTGVMHYKGLCFHTRHIENDFYYYKCYPTENAAKANNAISVRWCKTCAEKRRII